MTHRWSHLVRHGLLGSTLLAATAGVAGAEPCDDQADQSVSFVVGVQVSPRARLVGGLEYRRCLSDNTEALVRFEAGGGTPRLVGGLRARPFDRMDTDGTDGSTEQLGAEAGVLVDLHGRFGAHVALTYGTHWAYLAAQMQHRFDGAEATRAALVAGFSPFTASRGAVVEGRPIVHDGAFLRPAITRAGVAGSREDRAVAEHFTRSAQFEASSVWTFLRLANELAAVGAPAHLIAAALDAAEDEIRHAELCAGAAGGVELAALPAHVAAPRFAARSTAALVVLAREAWLEGCLNEGTAAREAALAATEAEPPTSALLAAIARDEAGHAELSWAVLAWIHAVAPEALAGLAELPRSGAPTGDVDAALVRRGLPSLAVRREAWASAQADALGRLAALA